MRIRNLDLERQYGQASANRELGSEEGSPETATTASIARSGRSLSARNDVVALFIRRAVRPGLPPPLNSKRKLLIRLTPDLSMRPAV